MRENVTQIQETQRVPIKRNPKKPTSRHIIVKMANFPDKERILKEVRDKKEVTYKGAPIRLATDFSMEMLQARREWQKIFQVMRTRGLQPRLHYSARLSIKIKGQVRSFPEKNKSKRIHLHQTSSARDAKGAAVRKGKKREKERNIGTKNQQ